MDIEHCDCLSWFSGVGESHEQDGETLRAASVPRAKTASGDPAMAFELRDGTGFILVAGSSVGSDIAAG
jgi:hypothetical protein